MTTVTQELTGTFTADPYHSSFLLAVQHMQVSSFRATFGDVEARLEGGESGVSLEGRARVASVSITDPPEMREHVVNGEEFFDGGNHPEIVSAQLASSSPRTAASRSTASSRSRASRGPSPRPARTSRRSRIPTERPARRSSSAPSSIAAIGT
jgi:hypothetical protein